MKTTTTNYKKLAAVLQDKYIGEGTENELKKAIREAFKKYTIDFWEPCVASAEEFPHNGFKEEIHIAEYHIGSIFYGKITSGTPDWNTIEDVAIYKTAENFLKNSL